MRTFGVHTFSPSINKRLSNFLAGISRGCSRVLMLDYDGTIAPLAIDPERAFPYSEIPPLLRQLQQTGTRLIVVAGQPASSTARLLGVPGVEIWGCHGMERLRSDGTAQTPDLDSSSLQSISDITDLLAKEGLRQFMEPRLAGIAVHWRGRDVLAGHLRSKVVNVWSNLENREELRLASFEGSIEISLDIRQKSDIVRTVLSEAEPGCAVAYLGDDSADEDAFRALRGHGLNVLVREEYRPTVADVWIQPPDDVTSFLRAWNYACQADELVSTPAAKRSQ